MRVIAASKATSRSATSRVWDISGELMTATSADTDLEALIDSCIASRETRVEDWDTLAFQAKAARRSRSCPPTRRPRRCTA